MEFFKGINGIFYILAVMGVVLAIERVAPWRRGVKIDAPRWLRNASMTFYGIVIISLIPFIAGYAASINAAQNGIGLFNAISAPNWAPFLLTLVIVDIVYYVEHRALHKWYFLWRAHRPHHSDAHIDATTALRFHPFETVLRTIFETGVIFLMGLPPEGILLSFAAHTACNYIQHANIALPAIVDRHAPLIFTTPKIHRLHHSADPDHQYKNFGTIFTLWDRMFGTYCPPEKLRDDERFGVDGVEGMESDSFANLALDPFRKPVGGSVPHPKEPVRD